MSPLALKLLLYAVGAAAVIGGVWAVYERVKQIGWDERDALCVAADNSAYIKQLEQQRDAATATANIGRLSRERLGVALGEINVEVQSSIEVVRARWDRPATEWPDSVRAELQAGIDAANRAAEGRL